MRQVECEEVGFLLDPADHRQGFAKISLGVARRVVQRDKHLPLTALLLAHVILDDGVAAGEPVLVPQPIKNPLGRVTLLAVLADIVAQPLLDDLGEPVQLRRSAPSADTPAAPKSSPSSSRSRAKSQNDVPPRAHSSRPAWRDGPSDTVPR